MAQVRILRTDDFTGGLNLRADPFQLGQSESPDLLNVDVDPRGGFARRNGFGHWNESPLELYGTPPVAIADGALTPKGMWVWHADPCVVFVSANGTVINASDNVDLNLVVASDFGASFAEWESISTRSSVGGVYMALGIGATAGVVTTDGTTAVALTVSATGAWQDSFATPTGTHMPLADHVANHAGYLWVASTKEDGTEYPNRVRFSHSLFPESWREVDYIDVVGGGARITALLPFGEMLLVFKEGSIWAIYGNDPTNFQLVALTREMGVTRPQHVAVTETKLYFFSLAAGIYSFDGRSFTDVFEQLHPLIDEDVIYGSHTEYCYLFYTTKRLWFSFKSASSTVDNDKIYVYDPSVGRRGAWVAYQLADGHGLSGGADIYGPTGDLLSVGLHPVDPHLMRLDNLTALLDTTATGDAGFESYYVTRWHDAGIVSARKMWRRPDLVVKQPTTETTLDVEVYHNWDEETIKRLWHVTLAAGAVGLTWQAEVVEPDDNDGWNEANWGGSARGAAFARGSNIGLARSVQLKISGPTTSTWGVNSISYKYIPRKVR